MSKSSKLFCCLCFLGIKTAVNSSLLQTVFHGLPTDAPACLPECKWKRAHLFDVPVEILQCVSKGYAEATEQRLHPARQIELRLENGFCSAPDILLLGFRHPDLNRHFAFSPFRYRQTFLRVFTERHLLTVPSISCHNLNMQVKFWEKNIILFPNFAQTTAFL